MADDDLFKKPQNHRINLLQLWHVCYYVIYQKIGKQTWAVINKCTLRLNVNLYVYFNMCIFSLVDSQTHGGGHGR